jgi:hypothetical protein
MPVCVPVLDNCDAAANEDGNVVNESTVAIAISAAKIRVIGVFFPRFRQGGVIESPIGAADRVTYLVSRLPPEQLALSQVRRSPDSSYQ